MMMMKITTTSDERRRKKCNLTQYYKIKSSLFVCVFVGERMSQKKDFTKFFCSNKEKSKIKIHKRKGKGFHHILFFTFIRLLLRLTPFSTNLSSFWVQFNLNSVFQWRRLVFWWDRNNLMQLWFGGKQLRNLQVRNTWTPVQRLVQFGAPRIQQWIGQLQIA